MKGSKGQATGQGQATEFVIVMGDHNPRAFTSPRGRNAELRQRWTYDPAQAYVYPSWQSADAAIKRGQKAGWGDMKIAQYYTYGEWLAELSKPAAEPSQETQPQPAAKDQDSGEWVSTVAEMWTETLAITVKDSYTPDQDPWEWVSIVVKRDQYKVFSQQDLETLAAMATYSRLAAQPAAEPSQETPQAAPVTYPVTAGGLNTVHLSISTLEGLASGYEKDKREIMINANRAGFCDLQDTRIKALESEIVKLSEWARVARRVLHSLGLPAPGDSQ